MAPRYSKTQALSDLFTNANQVANTTAGLIQNYQEEHAQIKARTAQYEYESKQQNFLQELQSSNDFEDWEQKTENFLEETRNAFGKEYPRGLTAKLINQQMEANRANLLYKVRQSAFEGIRKENFNEQNKQIDYLVNNRYGQEGLSDTKAVIDEQYKMGYIDAETRDKRYAESMRAFDLKTCDNYAGSVVQNAVQNGQTWEQTKANIESLFSEREALSVGADTDKLYSPDEKAAVMQSALQTAEKKYNSSLESFQQENYDNLTRYVDRILQDPTNEDVYKAQGMNALNIVMEKNPLALSTTKRLELERAFKINEKDETGSGNTGRAFSNATKEIDKKLEGLVNAVKTGTGSLKTLGLSSGQDGMAYLENYVSEVAKAYNLSDEDTLYLKNNYHQEWLSKMEKAYRDIPEVQQTLTWIKNMSNEWSRNGAYGKDELQVQLENFCMDRFTSVDFSDPKQVAAVKQDIVNFQSTITSSEFAKKKKGQEEDNAFNAKHTNRKGEWDEDTLVDGLYLLQQKNPGKVAYTDVRGNIVISPSAAKSVEAIDNKAMELLAAVTGKTQFNANWVNDFDSHDITRERVYTDESGNQWILRSTDKKDFEILKNGKVETTYKEYKNAGKKANEEAKAKAKEAAKQASAERQKVEFETMAKSDKSPDPHFPDGYWKQMSYESRLEYIYHLKGVPYPNN